MTIVTETLRRARSNPSAMPYEQQFISPISEIRDLPSARIFRTRLETLEGNFRDALVNKWTKYGEEIIDFSRATINRIEEFACNIVPFIPDQFHQLGADSDESLMLYYSYTPWVSLMRRLVTENSNGLIWIDNQPLIRADIMEQQPDNIRLEFRPKPRHRRIDVRTGISHDWPIEQDAEHAGYYRFNPSSTFYYLVARNYIQENYDRNVIERLKNDQLLNRETLARHLPIISFVAEAIFLEDSDYFTDFITRLAETIGGEEGFGAAYAVYEDIRERYINMRDNIGKLTSPARILYEASQRLGRNYLLWKLFLLHEAKDEKAQSPAWEYPDRPAVITPEALNQSLTYKDKFWEKLFKYGGIRKTMKKEFGGEDKSETRSIYRTAIRERKVIAGLIMIYAHVLGYDRATAKRLAAIAQMAWGVIVSYDNVIDGHRERKGRRTDFAIEGLPVALNRTMLGLADVLRKTLRLDVEGTALIENFLNMFDASCKGDQHARLLSWDNLPEDFLTVMSEMVTAFSWFPEYMGQKTKLKDAGNAFARFLAYVHTIGQMNNDIEDLSPGKKHEAGSDIPNRITLFWKTLVDLPEEVVPVQQKDLIKKVFEMTRVFAQTTGRSPTTKDIPEIAEIIIVGRAHRKTVVRALYPLIRKQVYEPAKPELENGFTHVPLMDETNSRYMKILAAGLEQEWDKFCKAGDIEENE